MSIESDDRTRPESQMSPLPFRIACPLVPTWISYASCIQFEACELLCQAKRGDAASIPSGLLLCSVCRCTGDANAVIDKIKPPQNTAERTRRTISLRPIDITG